MSGSHLIFLSLIFLSRWKFTKKYHKSVENYSLHKNFIIGNVSSKKHSLSPRNPSFQSISYFSFSDWCKIYSWNWSVCNRVYLHFPPLNALHQSKIVDVQYNILCQLWEKNIIISQGFSWFPEQKNFFSSFTLKARKKLALPEKKTPSKKKNHVCQTFFLSRSILIGYALDFFFLPSALICVLNFFPCCIKNKLNFWDEQAQNGYMCRNRAAVEGEARIDGEL